MRPTIIAAMLTFGLLPDVEAQGTGSGTPIGTSAAKLPYAVVEDPLQIPPEANFGEVAAVAVDRRGHLYVFNRGPRPLMEFDASGKYVHELAPGLVSHAHSVRVDREGYLWLVDDADHHVIRLDARGRVVMVLGRRGSEGETQDLFNRPTDVAVNSRGEIFVTDGYVNSRVVKFSREGAFLFAWGSKGSGPGQFDTPHAVGIDAQDHVYVADRENGRIQIFDAEGRFLSQWTGFVRPQGLFIDSDQSVYVGDVRRIVKLNVEGQVLGIFGERGRGRGQFIGLHGLAIGPGGELYTAELINWRVQKLMPAPTKGPTYDREDVRDDGREARTSR